MGGAAPVLGGLGAGLLGGGLGGALGGGGGPQQTSQASSLADFLLAALQDPAALQQAFAGLSIPQFGGPLSQDPLGIQNQALQQGQAALTAAQGLDPNQLTQGIGDIAGGRDFAPQSVLDILGGLQSGQQQTIDFRRLGPGVPGGPPPTGGPLGQNLLQRLGGQGADVSALSPFVGARTDFSPLAGLAGVGGTPFGGLLGGFAQGGAPVGTDILSQLAGGGPAGVGAAQQQLGNLAGGGLVGQIQNLLTAGEGAERRRIDEEASRLREGFSAAGTKRSIGAQRAEGELRARGAEQGIAERQRLSGQLLTQLAPSQVGAASAAGQLGIGGFGAQTGAAQALTQAGLGGQQIGLGAAQTLGSLGAGERQRATGAAGQLGALNLQDLSRAQQGAQGLSGLLEQGRGRQLGAGQSLAQLGLGLGQEQLGAAGLLQQGFQGEQQRALQASLGLPGATATAQQLPFNLAQQGFNLGEGFRQIGDVDRQRQLGEFARTQGGLFGPVLGGITGAPVVPGQNILGSLLGAAGSVGGGLAAKSDARLKSDQGPVFDALDLVESIDGRHFQWNSTGVQDIGVMAQQIETVLPQLVHDIDGVKHVSYNGLVAVLIEAVKELSREVEELKDAAADSISSISG